MISRQVKQSVLRTVRSSVVLTSGLYFADGLWARLVGAPPEDSEHLSGADVEADYNYAGTVAEAYLGGGPSPARIAEVGPGGNAAVALHMIARGAREVDLVDRFSFSHQAGQLDRLYRRFANHDDLRNVRFHTGKQAAAERFFTEHRGYDGIYSCAVLEHLVDPIGALASMIEALNAGGRLVHQVDLRDHGMFTAGGCHELTFLTIPEAFYRTMSRPRGRPNRVTLDRYRDLLDKSPVDYRILVTHLVGSGPLEQPMAVRDLPKDLLARACGLVETIRPKLARAFRAVPDADLAVASFRIEATKL